MLDHFTRKEILSVWDVLEEVFDGSLFSDLQINFIGNTSEKIKKELSKRKFKKSIKFYDYVDYNKATESVL